MKLFVVPLLLLAISALSACASEAGDSQFTVVTRKELTFRVYQGLPIYEGNDPNVALLHILLPGELEFDRASVGQEIPLNTAIVMPTIGDDEEALLTIEFRRSDFQEAFIRGLFFGEDSNLVSHPLANLGIETILTNERVILTTHPGVRLHLRNGTEALPNYKTFASDDIVGRITAVSGEVFVSSDPLWTKIRLYHFYVLVWSEVRGDHPDARFEKQSDGSIVITVPADTLRSPERYPPRVIPGP